MHPFINKFLCNLNFGRFGMTMQTNEESAALAKIGERAEQARRELTASPTPEQEMAAMLGGGLLRELSTFKGTPAEIWAQIQETSDDSVKKSSEAINMRIDLVHVYCHEVDIENETTGEIRRAIRSVLIDKNGSKYAFVSDGIAKDICRLMQYGLMPTPAEPLAISVKQVQTRGANRTFRIVQWKG